MEKKKRSYTDLKKKMDEVKLKEYCKSIAEEYAYSENGNVSSEIRKREDITRTCFYWILHISVTRNYVSDDVVKKMEAKSTSNMTKHCAKGIKDSESYYKELNNLRVSYAAELYDDQEVEAIVKKFAKSKEKEEEFAKNNNITVSILNRLIRRAFIEKITDDLTCKKIEKKSIENSSTKRFFEMLWEIRRHDEKFFK